jgi:ferredoxin
MKIFYFTSTGNNLYVAKEIGGELYSIPKMLKEKKFEFEADKIGFVFPVYYMGVPRIVKEFLKKVELKSDYIFAIMTYGNMAGASVTHFKKLAEKENIEIVYANELLMVDNYLPMFDIEEQINKIPSKNIEVNLKSIVEDIKVSKKYIAPKKMGEKVLTYAMQGYYSQSKGKADKKFIVNDNCISCKICEKVCPVDNIIVNGKPEYKHHCDECLACINLCPVKAITLKKEKGTMRYKNSHVEVAEIIKSNN